jgi:hypothetical protein
LKKVLSWCGFSLQEQRLEAVEESMFFVYSRAVPLRQQQPLLKSSD